MLLRSYAGARSLVNSTVPIAEPLNARMANFSVNGDKMRYFAGHPVNVGNISSRTGIALKSKVSPHLREENESVKVLWRVAMPFLRHTDENSSILGHFHIITSSVSVFMRKGFVLFINPFLL